MIRDGTSGIAKTARRALAASTRLQARLYHTRGGFDFKRSDPRSTSEMQAVRIRCPPTMEGQSNDCLLERGPATEGFLRWKSAGFMLELAAQNCYRGK